MSRELKDIISINYTRIDFLPDEKINEICVKIGLKIDDDYDKTYILRSIICRILYHNQSSFFGFKIKDCTLEIYTSRNHSCDNTLCSKTVTFVNSEKHGLEYTSSRKPYQDRIITKTIWDNGKLVSIETINEYNRNLITFYRYKDNVYHGICCKEFRILYYINGTETSKEKYDVFCDAEITQIKNNILEISPLIKELSDIIVEYAYDRELGYL